MIIRKACISDIERIVTLLEQLWYKQTIEELKPTFELYTNSNQYFLMVAETKAGSGAENDGEIVGFIAYSLSKVFVTGQNRLYIEGLIVDSCRRGIGIGRFLINHVENVAKELAPCAIELVSRASRAKDGTHDFYKSLGYSCSGDNEKKFFKKEIGSCADCANRT
jgi:ribosomal protein S18 acetylase RimI-like enzyme